MKKKLRIAVVVPHWRPALITGTEVFNEVVVKALKKLHNVSIITSDSYSIRYFRNLFYNPRIASSPHITRLSHQPVRAFLKYVLHIFFPFYHGPCVDNKELYRALTLEKFDIVYLSSIPHSLNYQTVKIIKENNLPTKIIIRPNYHAKVYVKNNIHYQYVLSKANAIHVWTFAEKRELRRDYQISAKKIIIMRPPLWKKQKGGVLSSPKLNSKKIILYAGEKNRDKGIYALISAVNHMKRDNVQIVTIGPHDWKWTCYRFLHPQSFLTDLGYVNAKKKDQLFKECDIFCLPSYADSFGFAYFDAWKYKKPIIAAQTEVTKELIQDNKAGLLVERDNVGEFAHTISILLENEALMDELGRNGYDYIQSSLSFRRNLKSYLSLFTI